jgi:hypothetical protein
MTTNSRSNRLLRFARLIFALSLIAGLSVAATVDRRPLAGRAKAWAAAHRGALPSTLGELMAYPFAYRQAIITQLSQAARDSLWKRQLELALASHPNWSPEQQAFVRDWARDTAHQPPDICMRVQKMFPDPADRSVFAGRNLGVVAAPSWTLRSRLVAISEAINGAGAVTAEEAWCTCLSGSSCTFCNQGDTCSGSSCVQLITCSCGSSNNNCDTACQTPPGGH